MINSDRINPMVIKELRQGLKSRSFLATFLGLQAAMVLSMFIYLATGTRSQSDIGFADGFFWFMLGLMLLMFMPLRSFQALHEEIKGNTLEMLFLTRMDAWKIAFGKWCALVIQIFLLVAAVLPYLVLRYFIGAIDVAGNLEQLFYQVVISMLLVSVGVGLSGWTSKLLRGLVILGAVMSLYMVPMMIYGFSVAGGGGGLFPMMGALDLVVGLMVCGLVMMFFVEYGASQIAPPAENHALRKRGLAILLTGVISLYALLGTGDAETMVLAMVLLIPLAVDALCEPLIGIPSVYLRLRKLRILRWLFYPGWASGYLFVSLLMALLFLVTYLLERDAEIWAGGLVAYNTLVLPFFCIRLIPALQRKPLAAYFAMQMLSLTFCLLVVFLEEVRFINDYFLLSHFFPMLGFFEGSDRGFDKLTPTLLMCVTLLMSSLILLKSRRPFLQMQYLSQGGNPT